MEYRRDIDGLRSIAVLLVVLYHFGFSSLSGGFVGVDVFFVISGYLITGIIFKQYQAQNFSFINFYARRVRRLLPALFLVLLTSFIVFSFILLPSDHVKLSKSIIWINGYLANIFFWLTHGGYFAGGAEEAPLLHTWSLAVEEQYYFIWPIYIVLGLKYLGQRNFIAASVVILLVAIYVSELATEMTIGAAYYLLPSRVFELMIGSLLALSWQWLPSANRFLNHALSLIGLGLIFYSSIALSKYDSFPGYNALYPTVGTALILYTNRLHMGVVNQLLSLKPFVAIGLVSYSLYLWHWPVVVFVRYSAIEITWTIQVVMLVAAFLLSWLGWKYVEIPFRTNNGISNKQVFAKFYAIPAGFLIGLSVLAIMQNGFDWRFSKEIIQMDLAYNSHPNKLRVGCHSPLRHSTLQPSEDCYMGEVGQANKKALLFGDSHANHYTGFLDELAKQKNIAVMDYTLDRCPPFFDMYWGQNAYKANKCKSRNDVAKEYLLSPTNNFHYAILAASWPTPRSSLLFDGRRRVTDNSEKAELIKQKLTATLTDIIQAGIIPILIKDTPFLVKVKPNCPLKKAQFNPALNCDIKSDPNLFMEALLLEIKAEYPQLVIVDPRNILCDGVSCITAYKGIPLYRDDDHLNDVGSRLLGESYANVIGNPFN